VERTFNVHGIEGIRVGRLRSFSILAAATVFGVVAMVAQTLLLRRFLWRFEAAETGVAFFLSSWLLWCGLGAAVAASGFGRRAVALLARYPWPLIGICALLYFVQYALIVNLRSWLGVPDYQAFPLPHLAAGCFLINAPLCFVAGLVMPSLCRGLEDAGVTVSRAFAWEAFGSALGGAGLLALLLAGIAPDPRDAAEWARYFPGATERPGRFETGGGTTLYGRHGGTFYALSSGGVSEVIPEGDRAMDIAALALSQRPYAQRVLLLGRVPLAAALALERLRPDIAVVWTPCDADYGMRLLALAVAEGSRVAAAGLPPQVLLDRAEQGSFDLVLVAPPSATTLEGAVWWMPAFATAVRRVTSRTGVALFHLDCEAAALTAERADLVGLTVQAVRQAWPEAGLFVPGGGGWWVAAQVPNLVYGVDKAPERFAMLKRETEYPSAAVARLYDPERVRRLAERQPALGGHEELAPPADSVPHEVLAAGLAAAVRADWPQSVPGLWLSRLREGGGGRLLGMALLALWMLPVCCGGSAGAERRLLAACLAACGALGLAVSLALMYRLQMRFGSLYLLAGTGSCLYFAGLFLGNRVGQRSLRWLGTSRSVRFSIAALIFVQAGTAFGLLAASDRVAAAGGVTALLLPAGMVAGAVVPLALAACAGSRAEGAAVFVLADALGAAVAGLFFAALVPLSGLPGAVAIFAALAIGLGVWVAVCGIRARLAAGVALAVALAVVGWRAKALVPGGIGAALSGIAGTEEMRRSGGGELPRRAPRGVPRKVDEQRVRAQMSAGILSTNDARWAQ